jgi:hypothetical protein
MRPQSMDDEDHARHAHWVLELTRGIHPNFRGKQHQAPTTVVDQDAHAELQGAHAT